MKIKLGLSKFFCKSPLTSEKKEDREPPISKENSTNALPQKVHTIECIEKQKEGVKSKIATFSLGGERM